MAVIGPGTQISHFRLTEKLGSGATGDVYRAEDTLLQRSVALKLLTRAENPQQKERFLREARICSALIHPHIAILYEAGWHESIPFLAMELVEGEMLSQKIRSGHLTPDQAVHYTQQLLDALEEAHSRGIVHRDIKSSNIKITAKNLVKILDFGMAKNLRDPGSKITGPGEVIGTVEFLSPEQVRGEEADARSDIYATGAVLYHMLKGTPPFDRETQVATLSAILKEEPPIEGQFARPLENILQKALAKDRSERYQTTKEFSNDLQALDRAGLLKPSHGDQISLAVLYFDTTEKLEQNDYLRLGITEDIITDLSKVAGVRVLSRHAVQKYKDKSPNFRMVMQELQVRYILHGSVQQIKNRIRITARLLDQFSSLPVWFDAYEKETSDIFELQEEVAKNITNALQIHLTDSEERSMGRRSTGNVKAYEFFLKGKHHYNASTAKDNVIAEELLLKATQIDPEFASAHAALSEVYVQRFYNWFDRKREWLKKAEDVLDRAWKLNDQFPEVHCTRGMLLYLKGDYAPAMEEIEKSIRLDPNYALAHDHSGEIYLHMGELEKSILAFHTEMRINEEVIYPYFYLVWIHSLLGDFGLARQILEQAIRKHSMNPLIYVLRGTFASYSNDLQQAKQDLTEAIQLNPNNSFATARLAVVEARNGNFSEALQLVENATEIIDPMDHHAAFDRACVLSLAGQKGESLRWLHRAIDTGWHCFYHYQHESNLNAIRNDPEFEVILNRLSAK